MNPVIEYQFEFEGGRHSEYRLELDAGSLEILSPPPPSTLPDWTKLSCEKCECCPLKSDETPYCPMAVHISGLVDRFKDEASHSKVKVRVITADREYFKETSMQVGLFSLFGLIMATSGCPITKFLKPMARYHLPFSNMEESIIRSVSIYLLRQYFVARTGAEPDFQLKGLDARYAQLQSVNLGMSKRLQKIPKTADATQNTVTSFHAISQMLCMSISRNLSAYQKIFEDF